MKHYDNKCDIWSCGIIMFIMLTGRPPFNEDNDLETQSLIKQGNWNMKSQVFNSISSIAKNLLKGLLTYDPTKRLTA